MLLAVYSSCTACVFSYQLQGLPSPLTCSPLVLVQNHSACLILSGVLHASVLCLCVHYPAEWLDNGQPRRRRPVKRLRHRRYPLPGDALAEARRQHREHLAARRVVGPVGEAVVRQPVGAVVAEVQGVTVGVRPGRPPVGEGLDRPTGAGGWG